MDSLGIIPVGLCPECKALVVRTRKDYNIVQMLLVLTNVLFSHVHRPCSWTTFLSLQLDGTM